MSSSSSTESGSQEQELIPSLPNDIALNILARVPRCLHPTLSLVSKPIRSLLSSPLFFNTRTALHSTEPIFYVASSYPGESWYALYRHPFGPNLIASYRIPPIPSFTYVHDAAFAVVGLNIYVIGGTKHVTMSSPFSRIPSREVRVLDCRFNRWGRGPSMLAERAHAVANVVDGKIYVMGGSNSGIRAEVLDPAVGKWVELPRPFHIQKPSLWLCDVCGEASAVVNDKVYINTQVDERIYHQVVFDTRSGAWERIVERENKLYLGPLSWMGSYTITVGPEKSMGVM